MIIVFSLRQHYQTLYMGEPLYYRYEMNHCDAFITDVYLEKNIYVFGYLSFRIMISIQNGPTYLVKKTLISPKFQVVCVIRPDN